MSLFRFLDNEYSCKMKLECPTTNSSCFPSSYTPPDVSYQFVHTEAGNDNFLYRFSWEKLPGMMIVFVIAQRRGEGGGGGGVKGNGEGVHDISII